MNNLIFLLFTLFTIVWIIIEIVFELFVELYNLVAGNILVSVAYTSRVYCVGNILEGLVWSEFSIFNRMCHLLSFSWLQEIYMGRSDSNLKMRRFTLGCVYLSLMPFSVGVCGNCTLLILAVDYQLYPKGSGITSSSPGCEKACNSLLETECACRCCVVKFSSQSIPATPFHLECVHSWAFLLLRMYQDYFSSVLSAVEHLKTTQIKKCC